MALTSAQLAAIKTFCEADSGISATYAEGGYNNDIAVAAYLNTVASPDFIVWRTDVDPNEIMRNGMDWTRVDNLSVGKARIWEWLTRIGKIDFSRVNVRAGIDATWIGTTADLAVRATVYTHGKRSATRAEKLLSTGTGSDADPAVMGFEGKVSLYDVSNSRA